MWCLNCVIRKCFVLSAQGRKEVGKCSPVQLIFLTLLLILTHTRSSMDNGNGMSGMHHYTQERRTGRGYERVKSVFMSGKNEGDGMSVWVMLSPYTSYLIPSRLYLSSFHQSV